MKGVICPMGLNDELGIRMKTYYEAIPKTKLMRRCPVAVRLRRQSFSHFYSWIQKTIR